jgi:hypothetical protein
VRAVGVVVLDVLAQHCREVAGSGDQEMVEAFPAQSADEAFGDRVGSRRADRCPEHLGVYGGEDGVERGSGLGVAIQPRRIGRAAPARSARGRVPGMRVGRPQQEIMLRAADGECAVGRLTAFALVRGCVRVLGTDRAAMASADGVGGPTERKWKCRCCPDGN